MLPWLAILLLAGCTAERAYDTGQAWQRNQCNKLPEKVEFDRCMSKANASYESYKQQTEPAQK